MDFFLSLYKNYNRINLIYKLWIRCPKFECDLYILRFEPMYNINKNINTISQNKKQCDNYSL